MKLKLTIQGKEYEIEIEQIDREKTKIKIGDKEFLFEEKKGNKEKTLVPQTSLPKRNFSKKEIKAPIAGTISEIFIKKGDFIKKGTKVILLSAMKMENEIISESEGNVKEIMVKINQKVKEGETLIVLD